VTLHRFLTLSLESLGATYLVRNGYIEIVPVSFAAAVTKSPPAEQTPPRLAEPLVSVILKEKPLNEALAKVAEMYDLTVVVAPQAGDARTGFVNGRLLNVPAQKALELLAVQCDLRVVRRGGAFLVTSRDHANELFEENLERQKKQIELKWFRAEGPARPAAPAPEKPAEKPIQKPAER
jgi:hypothetical protein